MPLYVMESITSPSVGVERRDGEERVRRKRGEKWRERMCKRIRVLDKMGVKIKGVNEENG